MMGYVMYRRKCINLLMNERYFLNINYIKRCLFRHTLWVKYKYIVQVTGLNLYMGLQPNECFHSLLKLKMDAERQLEIGYKITKLT